MSYKSGDTSFGHGIITTSFSSNISRTATSDAELFTIPAYSVIKQVTIIGPKSNAGTSAVLSLGSDGGGGSDFLAAFNVKTNGVVSYPSSFNSLGASTDPNPIIVTGVYSEDGNASSAGGPWEIIVDVIGSGQ